MELNNDEQLFFKIEDYLAGKLPPEEAEAFERDMAADPELAETVEMQRFEREGMEFMMEEKLRAEMKSWKNGPPPGEAPAPAPVSPKPPGGRRFKWVFLSVLLLGLAGVFLFKNPPEEPAGPEKETPSSGQPGQHEPVKTPPQDQVGIDNPDTQSPKSPDVQPVDDRYADLAYAEYKTPENLRDGLRSGSGSSEATVLTPALKYLGNTPPDYKNAIPELRRIKKQEHPAAYELAQELLAHAYFKTEQHDRAAAIFGTMARQKLSATAHDQAEWYLVLSLLPDYPNQKTLVDSLLKKMSDPKSYHGFEQNAVDLKKKLADIGR